MPMTFQYIDNGGVLLHATGTLTDDDIYILNEELYSSEQSINRIRYQICDYTQVDKLEISSQGMRKIAEQDRMAAELNPGMLIAVAASSKSTYGMARMWETFASDSPLHIHVFETKAECEAWLESKLSS